MLFNALLMINYTVIAYTFFTIIDNAKQVNYMYLIL